MQKKIINDIIIKRSIREIPIAREKKRINIDDEHNHQTSRSTNREPNWQRKPINPKFVIWLLAIICVLALFFGLSILFSSATVIISPRTEKISFNNEVFTAKLNNPEITDLSYEILNLKQIATEEVSATEEKDVALKASGKIVIYNNYSSAPQRLINNTRFESTTGKIYRINSSVVVPGTKTVAGKLIPGSIEAVVYADQAGSEYNLKLGDLSGDFKIPGFKGDQRYSSFYARQKEDITGGFVGKQRIVDVKLRLEKEENLKKILREKLIKELYAVKPDNYLIIKDGYSIDYTNQPDLIVNNDKVKISIEGSLNGIVFNNLKTSRQIAEKKITNFDSLPTELILSDNLIATFEGKDNTVLWKNNTIDIKLNGEATIKWIYDGDTIKKDLAGEKEANVQSILLKYKNSVKSIQVIFKPVWARYFPDDLNKIKIKESL